MCWKINKTKTRTIPSINLRILPCVSYSVSSVLCHKRLFRNSFSRIFFANQTAKRREFLIAVIQKCIHAHKYSVRPPFILSSAFIAANWQTITQFYWINGWIEKPSEEPNQQPNSFVQFVQSTFGLNHNKNHWTYKCHLHKMFK